MKILLNGYNFSRNGQKLYYGGPRNFTKNFLRYLDIHNHPYTSIVIAGKKEKNSTFKLTTKVQKNNSTLYLTLRLNTPDVFLAKSNKLPSSLNHPISVIKSIIAQEKPDVVLLNGFSISNWMILTAAKQLNIPVTAVHHGLWFKEIKDAAKKITSSGLHILQEMEKDITRHASKEIFLNDFSLKEYNRELIKTSRNRTAIIPLPYNPLFGNSKIFTKPKKNIVKIGMVSRWDPIKNPVAYLHLVQKAKSLKLPWKFSAVIKLYTQYPELEKFNSPFLKEIKVINQMSPTQLKSYYSNHDIMILPSKFDVSPTVVMESVLQGTGTLISPNVGWTDIFKRFGADDWIIDFSNPEKVIERIKLLLHKKFPPKLINYIKKEHNQDTVYRKYLKLLRTTI